jgi:hypothetical protein
MRARSWLPLFALGTALMACSSPESEKSAQAAQQALGRYESEAQALFQAIEAQSPGPQIAQRADELIALSRVIAAGFVQAQPTCSEYLGAVLGALDQLDRLSSEQLEHDYHQDDALPSAPALCYHAKDLVVHPASVRALLREGDDAERRAQMGREIQEVLGHIQAVRSQLAS